jgi:pyruvate, orthophosphate dikinase
MPEAYAELRRSPAVSNATTATCRTWSSPWSTGPLWLLQTRTGSARPRPRSGSRWRWWTRNSSPEEALLRVSPEQVDFFLHPQLDESARRRRELHRHGTQRLARCRGGGRGARRGSAERWGRDEGARHHGSARDEARRRPRHAGRARASSPAGVAARATQPWWPGSSASRPWWGSMTSRSTWRRGRCREAWSSGRGAHLHRRTPRATSTWVSSHRVPDIQDPWLTRLLGGPTSSGPWRSGPTRTIRSTRSVPGNTGPGHRSLPDRAHVLRRGPAPVVREMIMARTARSGRRRWRGSCPCSVADFEGSSAHGRAAGGDPPPRPPPARVPAELRGAPLTGAGRPEAAAPAPGHLHQIDELLARSGSSRTSWIGSRPARENPMLGTRGVRLGILLPELTRMQVRAIFEAAVDCAARTGWTPGRGHDPPGERT